MLINIKLRKDLCYRYRNKIRDISITVDKIFLPNRLFRFSSNFVKDLGKSRFARIKNICIWSGRRRGIVKFGFSRHAIKFIGTRGRWLGFRKTSF